MFFETIAKFDPFQFICGTPKLGIHVYYNFTKFHQNWMKNLKVLMIAHFSVQNFKVSVEL